MNILFVGDIVGSPGREILSKKIKEIKEEYDIHAIIINGENAAGGRGIKADKCDELFSLDIDCITMGNHTWDQKEIINIFEYEPRLIRPINYPTGTPGKGTYIFEYKNIKIAVVNALGRIFLSTLDCPFKAVEKEVERIKGETDIIIIDFHAEATSEKQAFGYFLDGKVSAVIGTHTHVQTNDERILPNGTAYITDVGMTGPRNSIIGMEINAVVNKFLSQLPARFNVAKGEKQLNAVVLDIDEKTGKARNIEKIAIFMD